MVTINDIVKGHYDVINISSKVNRIEKLIEEVIRPIENAGYEIKVIYGLEYPEKIVTAGDTDKLIDHIYGYGCDITTGDIEKNMELAYALKRHAIKSGVKKLELYENYIHISTFEE